MLDSPPPLQHAINDSDNNDAAADHDPVLRVLDFLLLYTMLLII